MLHDIFGHKKQIGLLEKSIEIGKIPHAYIFAGPSFVGKKTVARAFTVKLLEVQNIKEDFFHPDFLEISGEEAIKIEQIRDLIYKLSLKPYQAKYKVALIDNAENMTVEAQNSILKILEEPKDYTIILLITSNPNKLLRTITSRAQKIIFGLVQPEDYEKLLPGKLDAQTKELVLTIASGRPGLAKNIAEDEEMVEKLKGTENYYKILRSDDLVEKLKLAYDLADLETSELKQFLDFWLMKFEHELVLAPGLKIANDLSAMNLARKYLDQNVNSKLLLTNLMLNL